MSKLRPAVAKILVHSEGLGAPDAETVRKRAIEIAQIDGRETYNEGDWKQAREELHGGSRDEDSGAEEMGMSAMVSGHDMVSADLGRHVERMPMEDDGNVVEELWREGMEEADHERMLEASRMQREEDRLDELDAPDSE